MGNIINKELRIDAKVSNLNQVTDFINSYLEENEASLKVINQLDIAIEELFVNICNYAYLDSEGEALINISIEDNIASISLIDNGIPFNPLEASEPDINLPANQRRVGGLGIFMVKKMVDVLSYEYKNKQNILTLKKVIK